VITMLSDEMVHDETGSYYTAVEVDRSCAPACGEGRLEYPGEEDEGRVAVCSLNRGHKGKHYDDEIDFTW